MINDVAITRLPYFVSESKLFWVHVGVLQDVMKSLVWRYVTSEQSKNEQAPVTEDDVNELKQQITSFRYDLLDVLKDNGMKINKVQRKRGEGMCSFSGKVMPPILCVE